MKLFNINQEDGISLLEAIVGLAIISIVAACFMTGLATNMKADVVQDKAAYGEAIALSQMEYVKLQPFSTNEWSYSVSTTDRSSVQQPSWWDDENPSLIDGNYPGYRAEIIAEDFDADGDNIIEIPGDDSDIRRITITVFNDNNELLISLIAYKTNK